MFAQKKKTEWEEMEVGAGMIYVGQICYETPVGYKKFFLFKNTKMFLFFFFFQKWATHPPVKKKGRLDQDQDP